MKIKDELYRNYKLLEGDLAFRAWSKTAEGRASGGLLQELKGKYQGRRCFVMGNGPSLLKCDLDKLAGEVTIVSNAHYLIWDKLSFIPQFLTVEDRLVAEDRAKELRALDRITKVFPFDLKDTLLDDGPRTIYLNFQRLHRPFPKFSFDLRQKAYWGGTVSFLNLQLAVHLGCDPIVLIGFDHNYKVPTGQIVDSVIKSTEVDVNHIHPDYFGPGYRWHDPNVARMEIGYRYARAQLEARGMRILNATVGGHLEAFERVAYDSLFTTGTSK